MISGLTPLARRHTDPGSQKTKPEKPLTRIAEQTIISTPKKTPKKTDSEATQSSGKDESRILQWPPQKLQNALRSPLNHSISLLSFLMVAINATYVGILLAHNGQDVESLGIMWQFVGQFARLGPTAVPLMFAFVVGRAVKSYAHWRLQKGECIGTLDTLFGSTTFTGTITTMIELQRFGVVPAFLVIIWILSPLGGQAAFRVLTPRHEEISSNSTLLYLDNEVPFPSRYRKHAKAGQQTIVNTLFLGSLAAPDAVKSSKVDTWGNVKIPMIEYLTNHYKLNEDGWIDLEKYEDEIVYSSLLGIPVANVSQRHRSSFTLKTSYLMLNCTELQMFAGNAHEEVTYPRKGCEAAQCNIKFTWGEFATVPDPGGMQNSTPEYERCTDPRVAARDLLYWNYDYVDSSTQSTLAKCSMTTSFVEVRVSCIGWDCGVVEMRPTASTSEARPNSNITFFDECPFTGLNYMWETFFSYFATLTEEYNKQGLNSFIQSYLVDPGLGLNCSATVDLPPVYGVGKKLFSIHLGQLLNTYWQALIGDEPLFLGHPENYDGVTKWPLASEFSRTYFNYRFLDTQATVYVGLKALRYQKAWMAVLIVATLVLLLTTVLEFALGLKIWVPKLLMNISTLTRGNPNFDVPAGGGALSDEARAKLLADIKVRFGDAEGANESSDLIIGNCVEYGGRVSKLTKGRLYA
ncbi:hypothetical protein CFIO01_09109 [Colletotrichum fioriniae PJ7]|uniref:Uncharacterized protein n=1 Tax=Colletotrichum fioriniae PJ7 TaxID=1445577 RepID=A0A010QJG3_9PEZI|nr:hypothetical protein CFIO01_09109 [Colletotrichum fioriniae PJ7]